MWVEIYSHLGFLAELACLLTALVCGYHMQVILRERTPWVQLERVALAILAIALVANGSFYYPSWALVEGHRPTGAMVDIALLVYMLVVGFRGYIANRNAHNEGDERRIST